MEPTWTYSLVCAKNTETAFIAKEKLFSIFNADVNLNLWMRETAQENQVEYNQKLHVISRKEKKNIERKQMSTKSNAEIPQGKQPEVQIDSGKIIPRAISLPKSQKIGRKLSVRLPEGSQRSPSWGSERSDNTLSPKGLEIPSIDLLERKAQELMLRLDTVVGKIEIIDQILNDTKQ